MYGRFVREGAERESVAELPTRDSLVACEEARRRWGREMKRRFSSLPIYV